MIEAESTVRERASSAPATEVVLVTLVAVYNIVANLWLAPWMYIPANLAAAVVLIAIVRRHGIGWDHLGLARRHVPNGLRVGGIAMGVVGLGVAVGVALPITRALFEDARVVDASTWELVRQPLIRIPLGTAVFEEIVFRGVLLGMFLRRMTPLRAVTWSSLLFGLWHVLPTGLTVDNSPAIGDLANTRSGLTVAVVGAVIGTWLAGYVFCWLRLRANSLLAPIMLHIATNSFAYVGATVTVHVL